MTSATSISTTQYIEDEDGQLVEASIIQLVEEDENGLPTITGTTSLDANRAMVLNEATGEVEVIDFSDPTVSHEVEVVTVDSDRLFGARRLGGQVRLKNAPALLRNSRRVNNQGFHVQEVPQIQQVIMTPSTLPPASASFMKAGRQNSTPIVNTSHPHTSRLPHNNFSNINIIQPSSITTSPDGREQQFVILSDGGVPLANTEYSIVQDEDLQERLRELLMHQQDVKPNIMEITGSDQQTIYICDNGGQEDGVEVAEIMEEIDGQFVQSGGGNLIYHLDDAGNIISVSGLGGGDGTGTVVLEQHTTPTPTKKRGRKNATLVDNSKSAQKKRSQTELKCLEPDCQSVCYNVGELRKHLAQVHENHFDEETVVFGSEDAFKSWRESYERERMVSFIYRGGTKKIAKDQAVTYLICHRSGHYKPTMGDVSKRKRKMKPQGSCKMGGYCTAGIKLLKNLESGEVKMDICHTHYGHPLDNQAIPHLRVNPMLRNVILNKFKDGMSFNEVLEFIHHNPDGLEGLRLVDRRAVRNIFDQWKNPRRRSKASKLSADDIAVEEAEPMDLDGDLCTKILPDDLESTGNNTSLEEEIVSEEDSEIDDIDVDKTAPAPPRKQILVAKEMTESKIKTPKRKRAAETNVKDGDGEEDEEKADEEEKMEEGQSADEVTDDSQIFDITIVKEEEERNEEKQELEEPLPSPSKSNYTLRPKKRQSLAHLLKPKRYRKSSSGEEAKPSSIDDGKQSGGAPEKPSADDDKASADKDKEDVSLVVPDDAEAPVTPKTEKKKIPPPSASPADKKPGRKKKVSLVDIKKEYLSETVDEIIDMILKNPQSIESPSKQNPIKKRKSVRDMERELSDEEPDPKIVNNIEQCIEKLYKHGESGPSVLMYKKEGKIAPVYGDITKGFRESDRCIVLQTPVQRQLMQMFPNIIGVEVIEGKATDMKLVFVMVVDDYREAIPVAWMVSDVIEQRVVTNFFRCLRNECGEIAADYMMAPKSSDFHRLWCMTFSSKPNYIQNEYDARKDLRVTVQQNFTSEDTKKKVWSFVENLLTEKSMTKFNRELEKVEPFFKTLNSANSGVFLKLFQKHWSSAPEEWALAYRISTPVNTIFAADSFAKLKKFISFKGTKRLRYSVDHILKIGYDKCFLRSKRMFKGDQKHSQHLEELRRRHFLTTSWKIEYLKLTDDGYSWFVTLPEAERVLVTDVRSPCVCKTSCSECGICMHMYLCSCQDFRLLKIMCEHIHFVHTMRNGDIETETDPDPESQATEIKIISTTSELPASSSFTVYEPDGKISVSLSQDDPEAGSESNDPLGMSITGDLPSSPSPAPVLTSEDEKISSDEPEPTEVTSDATELPDPSTSTSAAHEKENENQVDPSPSEPESGIASITGDLPTSSSSPSPVTVNEEINEAPASSDKPEPESESANVAAEPSSADDEIDGKISTPTSKPETKSKSPKPATRRSAGQSPAASTSTAKEENNTKSVPLVKPDPEPESPKPVTRKTPRKKVDTPIPTISKPSTRNSTGNKKVEPTVGKKLDSSRNLRSRDSKTPTPSPRPQRSTRKASDKRQ